MDKKAEIIVNFSEILYKIVEKAKEDSIGYLIGSYNESSKECNVFNVVFFDRQTSELSEFKAELENQLPAGLEVIGVWNCDFISDDIIFEWLDLKKLTQEFQHLLALSCSAADFASQKNIPSENIRFVDVQNSSVNRNCRGFWKNPELLIKRTISFRVICSIPLTIHILENAIESDFANEIENAFEKLEYRFSCPPSDDCLSTSNVNVYKALKGNVFLNFADDGFYINDKLSADSSCYDLWRFIQEDEKLLKRKELTYMQDVIDLKLFHNISERKCNEKNGKYVPVIHYEMCDFYSSTVSLKFNAISVCSQDTKLSDLSYLLRLSLLRQVRNARTCMRAFSEFTDKKNIVMPEPFLFFIDHLKSFLFEFYPKQFSNDGLKDLRRSLCQVWNLPLDRPLITRENAFSFPNENNLYLRNVHEFVGPSGISDGGIISLVKGSYDYHHYMQDNMNDNGWGCAYRSFQTIWSWFLLQGYTDKPVPSHRAIQQALVNIGDRPDNFVGSKQWIGSLELSFCLSHLLNIESKILNISSGSDIVSKARELIQHFETEGTPVMIGGGVLAHTILGIHFSEDSGQAKFLVLDPHYTGDENIKTIVDKGWCGWKNPTFWEESSFYNLLLPQRPLDIF